MRGNGIDIVCVGWRRNLFLERDEMSVWGRNPWQTNIGQTRPRSALRLTISFWATESRLFRSSISCSNLLTSAWNEIFLNELLAP